jgi:metal-responsive CopG/Arc/MetJ family transcriptional regulator
VSLGVKEKLRRVIIRFPEETLDRLDGLAENLETSRAEVVREAVGEYLVRNPREVKKPTPRKSWSPWVYLRRS